MPWPEQLEQHRKRLAICATTTEDADKEKKQATKRREEFVPTFDHINIVVPVHLSGGVLLPGQSIGNFIGAFAARIQVRPRCCRMDNKMDTIVLMEVHKTFRSR
jgi:hypothetical protein